MANLIPEIGPREDDADKHLFEIAVKQTRAVTEMCGEEFNEIVLKMRVRSLQNPFGNPLELIEIRGPGDQRHETCSFSQQNCFLCMKGEAFSQQCNSGKIEKRQLLRRATLRRDTEFRSRLGMSSFAVALRPQT
jgi:hypothetical protein